MRYYRNQTRLERSEDMPEIIIKIGKTSAKLICSFNRIKRLSDDLFCTGDIETIDYCLEVYIQFLSNEEFDPFLWNAWEIKTTLIRLQPELENFVWKTEIIFWQIMKLLKLNSSFQTNPSDTQKMFMENLKKQFVKLIVLDGKYSSGQFTEIKGIFFERIYH